jgi:hypothetical protein
MPPPQFRIVPPRRILVGTRIAVNRRVWRNEWVDAWGGTMQSTGRTSHQLARRLHAICEFLVELPCIEKAKSKQRDFVVVLNWVYHWFAPSIKAAIARRTRRAFEALREMPGLCRRSFA